MLKFRVLRCRVVCAFLFFWSAKCQIQHLCDERQRHLVHQAPVARNAILAAAGPIAVVAPGSMGAALEHVELVPPRRMYILATTKTATGFNTKQRSFAPTPAPTGHSVGQPEVKPRYCHSRPHVALNKFKASLPSLLYTVVVFPWEVRLPNGA